MREYLLESRPLGTADPWTKIVEKTDTGVDNYGVYGQDFNQYGLIDSIEFGTIDIGFYNAGTNG